MSVIGPSDSSKQGHVLRWIALVIPDPETGKPHHARETDIDWDRQQAVQREGKPVWVCACGHDWTVDVIPE